MEALPATISCAVDDVAPVELNLPEANVDFVEACSALEQQLKAVLSLVNLEDMSISDILDLNCLSFFLGGMLRYPEDRLVKLTLLILRQLSRHLKKAFQATPGGAEWTTEVYRSLSVANLSKLSKLLQSKDPRTVEMTAHILENLASASDFLKNQIKRSKIEESFLLLATKAPPGLDLPPIISLMNCLYNCNGDQAMDVNCNGDQAMSLRELTLKMLAVEHGSTDSVEVQTFLPELRQTLEEAQPAQIPMACELLYRYLREGGLLRPWRVADAGLCLPLCNLLDHSDASVADCAARLVGDMVRGDDVLLNQTMVDSGVLNKMRRFLQDNREPSVSNALYVAGVLTTGSKMLSDMVLSTWLDDDTLNRLIRHESLRVRRSLALLLSNKDF